jgi:hypothetical protein
MDWTTFDQLLKGYGLGIVTLGAGIWWLQQELKASRAREDKANAQVLDLTRESFHSISQMMKLVENLTPTISGLSMAQKMELERTTASLKEHMNTVCDKLETAIKSQSQRIHTP